MNESLVVVGKIIAIANILGADFIQLATVVCGSSGKWHGIIKKASLNLGDLCLVYLPDAQLDPLIHAELDFMKKSNWRVKMQKFKGVPSECLITPLPLNLPECNIGDDLTGFCKVTKYYKPLPPNLQGKALGPFPSFIPKTDELNFQSCPELVDELLGKPYYITEKADGSSTTAYNHNGHFGICSRNLELIEDPKNGYWLVANKYNLKEKLPDGIAVQWETCGPKIQKNPMDLKEIDGFLFSAYNIHERRYLEFNEFRKLAKDLNMLTVRLIEWGNHFIKDGLQSRAEGTYSNGNQREGIVVRAQHNTHHKPISFKVINLNYE